MDERLAEPISGREVRTLLERLGTAEFGGKDVARVGDLIEVTDADPHVVARLFGEIRRQDYQAPRVSSASPCSTRRWTSA